MACEADVSMPLAAGSKRRFPPPRALPANWPFFICWRSTRARAWADRCRRPGHAHRELQALPGRIEAQLDGWREQMAVLANKYKSANTFLYLGRGIHYAIAREGALKLKEASYVHAEGYPTGELKHGPNALVSDTVPLVVLATVDRALDASVLCAMKRRCNCCATCRRRAQG
jgi:glucosamine--fructose-6-phosphate aminotransferase (isomerizing)